MKLKKSEMIFGAAILGESLPWNYPLPFVVKKTIPIATYWQGTARAVCTRYGKSLNAPVALVRRFSDGYELVSYRPLVWDTKLRKSPWIDYTNFDNEKLVSKSERERYLDAQLTIWKYGEYEKKGGVYA